MTPEQLAEMKKITAPPETRWTHGPKYLFDLGKEATGGVTPYEMKDARDTWYSKHRVKELDDGQRNCGGIMLSSHAYGDNLKDYHDWTKPEFARQPIIRDNFFRSTGAPPIHPRSHLPTHARFWLPLRAPPPARGLRPGAASVDCTEGSSPLASLGPRRRAAQDHFFLDESRARKAFKTRRALRATQARRLYSVVWARRRRGGDPRTSVLKGWRHRNLLGTAVRRVAQHSHCHCKSAWGRERCRGVTSEREGRMSRRGRL